MGQKLTNTIIGGVTLLGVGGGMLHEIDKSETNKAARAEVISSLSEVRDSIQTGGISTLEEPILDELDFLGRMLTGENRPEKIAEIGARIDGLRKKLTQVGAIVLTSSTP